MIMGKSSFILDRNKIKFLGINLTRKVKNL